MKQVFISAAVVTAFILPPLIAAQVIYAGRRAKEKGDNEPTIIINKAIDEGFDKIDEGWIAYLVAILKTKQWLSYAL